MYEIDKLSYLRIGVQGENVATTITVDMTTWADEHPGMRPNVLFKPWNEEIPFLMTSEYDEPILSWVVTSEATQTAGVGYTEIRAVNPDTGLVKKTRIIPTSVELSITPGEANASPPGSETWLNQMLAYKDGAEAAYEDAEEAKTDAVAAKDAAEAAQGEAEAAQFAAETAQTAAETAQAAAETAQEAAETAQTAAETAQTAAEAAQSEASGSAVDALTAQHRAQTAQSRAETAANTASSSSSTAVSAKTDAVNAKNAAESAQSGAVAAKAAAEAAYNGAVSAKSSAETAQSAAEAAQAAAEAAAASSVRYDTPQSLTETQQEQARENISAFGALDGSDLENAISQSEVEDLLLRDELPGTTTTVTMDSNGNPTSIVHSASGTTIRTDTFVWSTGSVTETRATSTKSITITTNLDTLAQTISGIVEVA